ncbi:UNVERIFIED_CONTAM: thiamine biosynthesis lipoprotein [Acetivibrio alkalicellulosi]
MNIRLKKLGFFSVVVILLLILQSGCMYNQNEIKRDLFALNTIINITVYGNKTTEKVLDEAIGRLYEIENRMSATISGSDVELININAGKIPVKVHDDTFFVVQKALEYSEITDGAFDISIYPLVKLWDIGSYTRKVPSEEEITKTLELVDYKKIKLDVDERTVYLEKEGMAIDLGGIAKGYAIDEVKGILKRGGIKHGIIYMGGDISVIGSKPDSTHWRIGIQDPRYDNEGTRYFAVVEKSDRSIVTSGDYERYMEVDGVRYHHIFHPHTGYPVDSNLMSLTVVAQTSIDADALSTALFVLGVDDGLNVIEELNEIDIVAVTKDKKVYFSKRLENKINIVKDDYEKRLFE